MIKIHLITISSYLKENMIDYNLHQHTIFSDGKENPVNYVEKAVELGMSAIGFTEHSPLPFSNSFSLKEENIDRYIFEIDQLKANYHDKMKIYRSLEMDYVPVISENFEYWRNRCKAEYLIGSIHLVKPVNHEKLWFTDGPDYRTYDQGIQELFDGNIRNAVKQFFLQTNEMIDTQNFEIIGHFDKIKMHNKNRFFTEDEKWYRDLLNETILLIKEKELIVEVNTRGLYKKRSDSLFPDGYALMKVKKAGIPILISSDAHQPSEMLSLFDFTEKYLVELGFKETMVYANGSWKSKPFEQILK